MTQKLKTTCAPTTTAMPPIMTRHLGDSLRHMHAQNFGASVLEKFRHLSDQERFPESGFFPSPVTYDQFFQ